jgi:uncharacterized membrane protein
MGRFEELDTDEPLAKRIERHDYDRLIMLSDGVFAIAITLAALEIKPPEHWSGSAADLFARIGPSLGAYAVTFIVISAFWFGNRRILAQLVRVDSVATTLFLIMLGLVALQPAGVKLLVEYGAGGQAFWIYYGLIVMSGLVQAASWGYAAFIGKLISPEIGTGLRWVRFVYALFLAPLIAAVAIMMSHRANTQTVLAGAAIILAVRTSRRWLERRFGGVA